MDNELVSIITPSYNSSRFISDTIQSVLEQSYENWEMLIVDDLSPDDSNQIIEKYCDKDDRIKLFKLERNAGPAVARNKAIKESKGRYIAFLDADDLWMPEKLTVQINFMKRNGLAFTYSSYNVMDESGCKLGVFNIRESINYFNMLKSCNVGCLTAIYDSQKLGKMYMPLIKKRQDYGLWLKILKEIGTTKGVAEPLAIYRIHAKSVSSNKINAARYQWKIYRQVEKLNFLNSVYYFIQYAYCGLRKYK